MPDTLPLLPTRVVLELAPDKLHPDSVRLRVTARYGHHDMVIEDVLLVERIGLDYLAQRIDYCKELLLQWLACQLVPPTTITTDEWRNMDAPLC